MLSTYILLENIERNIEYRLARKMYNYAEADSIFYGVSNIYLFSIVTAFLAVIIALYYSNFLKDENVRIWIYVSLVIVPEIDIMIFLIIRNI